MICNDFYFLDDFLNLVKKDYVKEYRLKSKYLFLYKNI